MRHEARLMSESDFSPYLKKCCFSKENDSLYVLLDDSICRIDLKTGKYENCCMVPDGYGKEIIFFKGLLCLDNKLYLQKEVDKPGLFVYDLIAREGIEYSLLAPNKKMLISHMMVANNTWIAVISRTFDEIVLINRENNDVSVLDDIKGHIISSIQERGYDFEFIRYMDYFFENDVLWLNVNAVDKDIFIKVSFPAFELVDVIDADLSGQHYGLYIDGRYLYFQNDYENENSIVKYNLESGNIEKVFSINGKCETRGDIYGFGDNTVLVLRDGTILGLNKTKSSYDFVEKNAFVQGVLDDEGKLLLVKKDGVHIWNVIDNTQRTIQFSALKMFIDEIALC